MRLFLCAAFLCTASIVAPLFVRDFSGPQVPAGVYIPNWLCRNTKHLPPAKRENPLRIGKTTVEKVRWQRHNGESH